MERLLVVLEASIVTNGGPLTVTEIAQTTGVPVSTTWRLVSQLVSWRFLDDSGGGRFVAGPRLVQLSLSVTDGLHSVDALTRATRELSTTTGESVTAGLLVGNTLLIVARTESDESLRAVTRVGEVISPSTSAMGKAILSRLPVERQLPLLEAEVGDRAAEVLAELTAEITRARADRVALDEETYAVGLRCRAAAITDVADEAVAGLSIGGPSARFTRARADEAALPLVVQAQRLSARGRPFDGTAAAS
jgi:IclR family acetate operon transcriptional repressor